MNGYVDYSTNTIVDSTAFPNKGIGDAIPHEELFEVNPSELNNLVLSNKQNIVDYSANMHAKANKLLHKIQNESLTDSMQSTSEKLIEFLDQNTQLLTTMYEAIQSGKLGNVKIANNTLNTANVSNSHANVMGSNTNSVDNRKGSSNGNSLGDMFSSGANTFLELIGL